MRKFISAILVLMWMAWSGKSAQAANFNVNPILVLLSAKSPTAILTITNESDQPSRFQLVLYSWNESPDGKSILNPTEDVIYFPRLLSIGPKENRTVRLGTQVPPGPVEKSYRIMVTELPSAQNGNTQVQMLLQVSVPIFIVPAVSTTGGKIENFRVKNRHLSFSIRNDGNIHYMLQTIRVTGTGLGNSEEYKDEFTGWYVLAGGIRRYDIDIPEDKCKSLKEITVEARAGQNKLTGQFALPADACNPTRP